MGLFKTKCRKCGKRLPKVLLTSDMLCFDCGVKAERRRRLDADVARIRKEVHGELRKDPAYREMERERKVQDDLGQEAWEARARYDEDGDLDALISAYQRIMRGDPYLHNAQAHAFYLVSLYIKAERYDDAWSYLNEMCVKTYRLDSGTVLDYEGVHDKIYAQRVRVAKKEKRWELALDCLCEQYLCRAKLRGELEESRFRKDAGVIVRRLRWDEGLVDHLVDVLRGCVARRDFAGGRFRDVVHGLAERAFER